MSKKLDAYRYEESDGVFDRFERIVKHLEEENKLLKEELKREREGNDFAAAMMKIIGTIKEEDAITSCMKSMRIISQRKIKQEDL